MPMGPFRHLFKELSRRRSDVHSPISHYSGDVAKLPLQSKLDESRKIHAELTRHVLKASNRLQSALSDYHCGSWDHGMAHNGQHIRNSSPNGVVAQHGSRKFT